MAEIKRFIEKSYAGKGDAVVRLNFAAVDAAVEALHEVKVPENGRQHARYPADRSAYRAGICPPGHWRDHGRAR